MHRMLSLCRLCSLRLLPTNAASASLARFCSSSSSSSSTSTSFDSSFGFERVEPEAKQERVNAVFNSVSESYDLMNDLMSVGLHRRWKSEFVAAASPRPHWRVLDVAGGTGDIAFRLLRRSRAAATKTATATATPVVENVEEFRRLAEQQQHRQQHRHRSQCHVTVCDISTAMMQVGKRRASSDNSVDPDDNSLSWVVGSAEQLPLPDNNFHLYTIAFGIRNCTNLPAVLNEAYRVLKPYGRFLCLEFCTLDNPVLSMLYDEYSFSVIPVMGQLVAGDWKSYQYLVESIRQFPDRREFAGMIERAGFNGVEYRTLLPGVCCVHSGYKLPC